MDRLYDVAISFLSTDKSLAVNLHAELSKTLRVFVYTERQEELAGTDGMESCRKPFLSDSNLVVVLYRNEWGKTPWTAIEERAIRDRMFNGGWRALLFVMLEGNSDPPPWVPETHIHLNYIDYGSGLAGAIKMRAQELGSVLKVETALERLTRAEAGERERRERTRLLETVGSAELEREYGSLVQKLNEKIADLNNHGSAIKLDGGGTGREFIVRTQKVSISIRLEMSYQINEAARLVLQEFDGQLFLPNEQKMYRPGYEPREISHSEFFFDYQAAHGWCWTRRKETAQTFDSTSTVVDNLMKQLISLHDDFASGKRPE